jgi:hypothetical protein
MAAINEQYAVGSAGGDMPERPGEKHGMMLLPAQGTDLRVVLSMHVQFQRPRFPHRHGQIVVLLREVR